MFTLISFSTVLFAIIIKRNVWFYIALFGFSLVVLSFALDGVWEGAIWRSMYVYDSVEMSLKLVFYWFVYFMAFIVFFLNLSNKKQPNFFYTLSETQVGYAVYITSFIAIGAAFYNLSQAPSISIYLTNLREWEAGFGKNVITNYLYFLHLSALTFFALILGYRKYNLLDIFIILLLFLTTLFHGIKFTIIHAFIYFIVARFVVKSEKLEKPEVIIGLALVALLIGFFTFGRGGGVGGFVDYILSASVNSFYVINRSEFYDISSLSVFNPLSILNIDRAYQRLIENTLESTSDGGFILNPKYNLEHAISKVGFAFGFGTLVFAFIFARIINWFRGLTVKSTFSIFLFLITLDSVFFLYTGFEFYKTKLWFVMCYSIFIVSFIRLIKNKNIKNPGL